MPKAKRKLTKISYGVRFSPDGEFLAANGKDVVLWSCPEITKHGRTHPLSHPHHLAFSPDSSLLAVKSTSGRIVLLDTVSGTVHVDFRNEKEKNGRNGDNSGCNLLFSDDGSQIVDGSANGFHTVRALDGSIVFREDFWPDQVLQILRHPGGRWWFRHSRRTYFPPDGTPGDRLIGREWPFKAGSFAQVELPSERWIVDTLFSQDGGSLVVFVDGSPDLSPSLLVFSFPSMQMFRQIDLPPGSEMARKMCFSPCGRKLAVVCSAMLIVFSTDDFSIRHRAKIPYGSDVAFSPDGSLLAVGSWSAGEVFAADELAATNII